jgi:hypothetical protein
MLARSPNLLCSTNITKGIDLILLGVNTPTKMTDIGAGQATNMSALEGATGDIALAAMPGAMTLRAKPPNHFTSYVVDLLTLWTSL